MHWGTKHNGAELLCDAGRARSAQAFQRRAEQREELRRAIGVAATRVMADPDAHAAVDLPRLVALAADADALVRWGPRAVSISRVW